MSVQTTCLSPAGRNVSISSGAVRSERSVQPWIATTPSRTSAPRIRRSGPNSAIHRANSSGSRTATLPQTARRAPASKTLRGCAALDAAAVLHLERGLRGDAFQYRQVLRFGGLRAVEIDHVQAACARLFEAKRRFERVAVVGFPARIVALREADAAAADEVRCGNHFDHA